MVHQPVNRVVQPVLVATDQLAKGRGPPLQAFSDEPLVVGTHGSLTHSDGDGRGLVPETGAAASPRTRTGCAGHDAIPAPRCQNQCAGPCPAPPCVCDAAAAAILPGWPGPP